jgi:hypothetical protein
MPYKLVDQDPDSSRSPAHTGVLEEARNCTTCVHRPTCGLLAYSSASAGLLMGGGFGPMGAIGQTMLAVLPMPCDGELWESKPVRGMPSDPHLRQLGLDSVGEPTGEPIPDDDATA